MVRNDDPPLSHRPRVPSSDDETSIEDGGGGKRTVLRGNVKKRWKRGNGWCGFRCLRFPRTMDVRLFFLLSCGGTLRNY